MSSSFSSRCGDVATARSADGSLLAVHRLDGDDSSSLSRTTVRCFDGRVSGGSLKFTLSALRRDVWATAPTPSSGVDDVGSGVALPSPFNDPSPVRKLVFASPRGAVDGDGSSSSVTSAAARPPRHLCAAKSDSVIIWDLDRGVATLAFSPGRDWAGNDDGKGKKKKRKNGVLCDIAACNGFLYALILCIDGGDGDEGGAKCRILEYDLESTDGNKCLKRKIKASSLAGEAMSAGGGDATSALLSLVGLAIRGTQMAVRLGDHVRVIDLGSGTKLRKIPIPREALLDHSSAGSGRSRSADDSVSAVVSFSDDGRWIGTSTPSGFVLCSNQGKQGMVTSTLATSDGGPTSDVDLRTFHGEGGREYIVISAYQANTGASFYTIPIDSITSGGNNEKGRKNNKQVVIPLDTSAPPIQPVANIRIKKGSRDGGGGTRSSVARIAMVAFHPIRSDRELSILLLDTSNRGGNATIQLQELCYADDSPEAGGGLCLKGNVTVEVKSEAGSGAGKKRKAVNGDFVLGPGEQGGEATLASDVPHGDQNKKLKKERENEAEGAGDDDDDDDFQLDEDDEDAVGAGRREQSIAERLALLSSTLERSSSDEEDDGDDDGGGVGSSGIVGQGFHPKSATPESLAAILSQALSSADHVQLEFAFQVKDKRIIEHSMAALQAMDRSDDGPKQQPKARTEFLSNLLVQLVTRISRRPARAATLGFWVKAVLVVLVRSGSGENVEVAGDDPQLGRMGREGLEVALKLGPLRNLLNERVECFPHLLRLEGRLALLGQQL